jgi:two-component system, NarL family, response regulator NreC
MSCRIRTLIVDDHPLFRHGLRQMISAEPRFEVVAEASDGISGLNEVNRAKPEVIILDITLPGMNGLEVVRQLRSTRCPAKVIILTMHGEDEVFNTAMNLEVQGYVLKENACTEIINCLKAVTSGDYYLSPSMSACLVNRRRRAASLAGVQPGLDSLTTAERRILRRIADNRTSKEIGTEFCVSPRTVDAHRANICSKLNLRGSHRLLRFAIEHRAEL